ncbi:8367_t:CDS:2 [Entrophospora sp. SA101]|nr:8367_t:CDS:2 [Entrophospora sp. SA101]CAJ0824400.1 6639_t:CDS:2 [Entrophospora sp. SA101]
MSLSTANEPVLQKGLGRFGVADTFIFGRIRLNKQDKDTILELNKAIGSNSGVCDTWIKVTKSDLNNNKLEGFVFMVIGSDVLY